MTASPGRFDSASKVAVVGLGRFGLALAQELREDPRFHLIAIEKDAALVNTLNQEGEWVAHFKGFDGTQLAELGVDRGLDLGVIAIGEDAEEVQRWVLALVELEVPRIMARAQTDTMAGIIARLLHTSEASGPHEVLRPEAQAAQRLAVRLLVPGLREIQSLRDSDHSVATLTLPRAYAGRLVESCGLREDYGINLLRLRRQPEPDSGSEPEEIIPVAPATELREGDEVTVLGLPQRIREFAEGA